MSKMRWLKWIPARLIRRVLLLMLLNALFTSNLESVAAPVIKKGSHAMPLSMNRKKQSSFFHPVLVRGLGKFSADDIKDLFNECGRIYSVQHGAGDKWLVYFTSKESAALGQRLNGTDFEGNQVRCSILKSSISAPADKKPKKIFGYTVVVNDIPASITMETIEAAVRKHGETLRLKMDKKKQGALWLEFKDKLSARRLSRKGLDIDDKVYKAVRVRPIIPSSDTSKHSSSDLKPASSRASTRTIMVSNLPAAAAAAAPARLSELFRRCGNVTAVRINARRGLAFVDFATVTAMRKARRTAWTLAGAALKVSACRRPLPPTAEKDLDEEKREAGVKKRRGPPPPGCVTVLVKNLPYTGRARA